MAGDRPEGGERKEGRKWRKGFPSRKKGEGDTEKKKSLLFPVLFSTSFLYIPVVMFMYARVNYPTTGSDTVDRPSIRKGGGLTAAIKINIEGLFS